MNYPDSNIGEFYRGNTAQSLPDRQNKEKGRKGTWNILCLSCNQGSRGDIFVESNEKDGTAVKSSFPILDVYSSFSSPSVSSSSSSSSLILVASVPFISACFINNTVNILLITIIKSNNPPIVNRLLPFTV